MRSESSRGPSPAVTILARSLERTGGAEQQYAQLAMGLAARGFPTRVITFYAGDGIEADLRAAGVTVTSLHKRGRWDVGGFVRRARLLIAQDRPAILQSFLVPPNLLALAIAGTGTRVVWGMRASDMDLARYDWTHRTLAFAEARLSRLPALIVVNSNAGRDVLLQRGFPAAKLAVVPNGIDTERFRPARERGRALRARWLGTSEGPLIGLVARLDPMKDHATFLRAARCLADAVPSARFVCIGSQATPTSAATRSLCTSLGLDGHVHWEPPRADIPDAMNALDVLALSSAFGEGFPNVVGEAMACGVRVVTTDVGDAADLVAGIGIVVERRNAAAMCAAWQQAWTLDEQRRAGLAQAARARIVTQFSHQRMVEQTAQHYVDLCAGAPS